MRSGSRAEPLGLEPGKHRRNIGGHKLGELQAAHVRDQPAGHELAVAEHGQRPEARLHRFQPSVEKLCHGRPRRWQGQARRRSERVKAGMARARMQGKRIGRPRRPPVEAERRWQQVRDLVLDGTLTRAEGARRLGVRRADFIAALAAFQKGRADFDPPGY
jgi:hypothetical protein